MNFQPRSYTRQRLEVPVIISWKDRHGTRRKARAHTRDISPAGMFLVSTSHPPVGAEVGLEALLPPLSELAPRWRMLVQGKVVRVQQPNNCARPAGFAAASDQVTVRAVEN